jgi:hypothetical protein
MSAIVSTPHFTLSSHEDGRLWRLTRSDVGITPAEVTEALSPIRVALRGVDVQEACLLVDVRQAPLSNDPALETAMSTQVHRIADAFVRWAVLVRTSAGALQVSRVARLDQREPFVVRDEAAALAWLLS